MNFTRIRPQSHQALCFATLLLTAPAFAQTATAPAPYTVQETLLGSGDVDITDPVFSADGRHIAYVTTRGTKQCLAVDGKSGAPFNMIPSYPVVFSPDGNHVAYQARNDSGWCVVLDDGAGKPYDAILAPPYKPLFSSDGKHLAYTASKNGKMVVVHDEKEDPEYIIINYCIPVFSPDGTRLAYNACVDEHKMPNGRVDLRQMAAVVDGKPGSAFAFVGAPVFSPDNRHVAYPVNDKGRDFWILDGKENPVVPAFADASGPHAIHALRADNNQGMVVSVNGQPGKPYRGVGPLVYSPNDLHVAYEGMVFNAQGEVEWHVVVDGREGPPHRGLDGAPETGGVRPTFSPDGLHIVYAATDGIGQGRPWRLVFDGNEGPMFDSVAGAVFSPDSAHLAYVVQQNQRSMIMFDGKLSAPYDNIPAINNLVFSPDSKHLVYKAQQGGQWYVFTDGQASAPYGLVGPLTFSPDGTLEFLALKQSALYRVKYTPVS